MVLSFSETTNGIGKTCSKRRGKGGNQECFDEGSGERCVGDVNNWSGRPKVVGNNSGTPFAHICSDGGFGETREVCGAPFRGALEKWFNPNG
jgi:hypothetical protein